MCLAVVNARNELTTRDHTTYYYDLKSYFSAAFTAPSLRKALEKNRRRIRNNEKGATFTEIVEGIGTGGLG